MINKSYKTWKEVFLVCFSFSKIKKVICKKLKDTYKVEIIGVDYESGRDINVIMGFIKKLIPGEKIFVSTLVI